jgi:GWxTD domain-containing protein
LNRSLLALLVCLFLAAIGNSPAHSQTRLRDLDPFYRHWVEEDVPYIISTDERKAFLALHTDIERDNFISAFWESRNPTPGANYNTYKEEYYRRLTYVSEHFGSKRYQDGWRTDMGRVYITLGPPQLKQTYHLSAGIRDFELWFYQSPTPALPTYFNLIFFRPGSGEEYRLYSPRSDGPYRLVTTGQQDNKSAMHQLQQQLGPEVAHAALSLIPSEPVDFDNLQPSFDSDLLLTQIRNLADNPIETARLTAAHDRRVATSSVIVNDGPDDLETTVFRDDRSRLTLSYLLRGHTPRPRLIGQRKDGSLGYSLTLRTTLFSESGQLIYEQQSPLEGILTDAQAVNARKRNFGVEERLPILPGSYQIEISLRNNLTGEATLFRKPLQVKDVPTSQLTISPLEVYNASPVSDPTGALPFSVSKLRFPPRSLQSATIHVGDRLAVAFQIHLPHPLGTASSKLQVHYLFGSVVTGGERPVEAEEEIDAEQADAAGNLLTGRRLDTMDLFPGSYRVVVRVSLGPQLPPAIATLQLRVVPADVSLDLWTAFGPEPPALSTDNLKRGRIAEVTGRWEEAASWYEDTLREYPDDPRVLEALVAVLSQLKRTQAIAALAKQGQLARAVDPQTVLVIAQALDSTGSTAQAITLVERQSSMQPTNTTLLLELGELYDHSGNRARAKEYRERASNVAQPTSH